jgi:hypothetical protein
LDKSSKGLPVDVKSPRLLEATFLARRQPDEKAGFAWSVLRRHVGSGNGGGIFGGIYSELAVAVRPQAMLVLCPLAVIPPRLSFVAAGGRRHLLPGRPGLQCPMRMCGVPLVAG